MLPKSGLGCFFGFFPLRTGHNVRIVLTLYRFFTFSQWQILLQFLFSLYILLRVVKTAEKSNRISAALPLAIDSIAEDMQYMARIHDDASAIPEEDMAGLEFTAYDDMMR